MPDVTRSLALHGPVRRTPQLMLERMLGQVTAETPADGPDGPVAVLERRLAELLGKEAALFFPSGTMAQQTALRIHADRRGRRGFAGHPAIHLDNWERQGYNAVHGLWFHPAGDRNELLTAADLEGIAEPLAAVVWELPQRDIGGQLPEWDDLVEQVDLVRGTGAAAHLDGARIFEAQTYYRRPLAEIADLFDTAYVSLYKSIQGVRGAVLAADASTVAAAEVWRQRLGGGIRDAWPLALIALAGLDDLLPRMAAFRDHAIAIAAAVTADGVARVVPDPPQTPILHLHVPVSKPALERAAARLLESDGLQVFLRARSAPDPDRSSFELTVGENAMAFSPAEVVQILRRLVTPAP